MIELMVVLAAVALLLSVAAPRYVQHLDHAREVALKENLHQLRIAIDRFYGDRGHYPADLGELVTQRYIRELPVDPLTDSVTTWVTSPPPDTAGRAATTANGGDAGVANVRSGAAGSSIDGSAYASW